MEGYGGAGFRIGQGVVMALQVVSTGSGNGLQLVVGQRMPELPAGNGECVVETVVGIVHLIDPEHRLQASFVETDVVGDERNRRNQVSSVFKRQLIREEHFFQTLLQQLPHFWEHRRLVSILLAQPVYPLAEIAVEVGFRLNEAVERIGHLPIAHHDHSHRADARRHLVGRLKVDGDEVP